MPRSDLAVVSTDKKKKTKLYTEHREDGKRRKVTTIRSADNYSLRRGLARD